MGYIYGTHVDMGSILLIETHPFRTRFARPKPRDHGQVQLPCQGFAFSFFILFSMATRRLVTVLVHKHMRAKLTPTNLMHLNFLFFFILDQMHIFFLFNLEKKNFLKISKKYSFYESVSFKAVLILADECMRKERCRT